MPLPLGTCALSAFLGLVAIAGPAPNTLAQSPGPVRPPDQEPQPSQAARIGRLIFLDTSLSFPPGQGCLSCHDPKSAFADSRRVSPGAVAGRTGTRNAPTLMYASLIPSLAYEDILTPDGKEIYAWEGGLFHDGRARDQFEQVRHPFFDPNEMNVPGPEALATRLQETTYAQELRDWIGEASWPDPAQVTYHAYRALVEFLKEPLFRPFDARIDDFLGGDQAALTPAEMRGLVVFQSAGKCASCHPLVPDNWPQPLLSDFGYDNLGVPSREKEKDPGLGKHTGERTELGMYRAPTLRNVELTAPYMHNGSLATLREVMEFYNKRDLEPHRWGPTDYPETVNHTDLGNLGLTDQQIDDLVALMSAFTDRSLLSEAVQKQSAFPKTPPGVPATEAIKLHFPDWTHRLDPVFQDKASRPK